MGREHQNALLALFGAEDLIAVGFQQGLNKIQDRMIIFHNQNLHKQLSLFYKVSIEF